MEKELKELLGIISGGETLNTEFKQKFSEFEKIAKEFIAFANTKGGKVIFGVRDNGKICGVHSEKEIEELTKKTVSEYIEPVIDFSFEYHEYQGKEIVVVNIPESQYKPHRIQDYKEELLVSEAQVYIRVNDKSVPASKEMIRILRVRSEEKPLYKYQVGKEEKRVFEFLEEFETINVKELSEAANISKRRASRTLVKMVRAGLLIIHTKENGEEFFTYSGEV
ncbi:MAG: RNA-binding domain-containing protein [Rhodothermaceae bacterium]